MQVAFLGTGGAFGYPQPFCSCQHCQQARREGGKNIRKRSAALINQDLLIDIGPDVPQASLLHNLPVSGVKYCLLTHPHPDHLDLSSLMGRSLSSDLPETPLHLYATRETLKRADQTYLRDVAGTSLLESQNQTELHLRIEAIKPMQPFTAGPYQITALPANHAIGTSAVLYAIEYKQTSIFYGTDTDSFPEETWYAFQDLELKFDLVILDNTHGINPPGFGHMNTGLVCEHAARMRAEGLLKPGADVYITHISHIGHPTHKDLVESVRPHGLRVAYDGLVLEPGK